MSIINQQLVSHSLINEILPLPSNIVMTDRFSPMNDTDSASCSGKCKTGKCMSQIIDDN